MVVAETDDMITHDVRNTSLANQPFVTHRLHFRSLANLNLTSSDKICHCV